jgi:integrase
MPQVRVALLEQAANQAGDRPGHQEAEVSMSLSEYAKQHRDRPHGNEDGSVKQIGKKVKKWEGIYHVYVTGEDGKTRRDTRRRVIGECARMTKTQARDEHRDFLRRLNSQPIAVKPKDTVAQICDDYFRLKSADWGENRCRTQRSILDHGIKPALGDRAIDSVTPDDLKLFVNALPERTYTPHTVTKRPDGTLKTIYSNKQKTGASEGYCKMVITALRCVFDLAFERDLIRKNPARSKAIKLTVPKSAKPPDKSVFPPSQLPALLAELSDEDRLIVNLSFEGGTRPNELFAVKGADVGSNILIIRRALTQKRKFKDPKTASSVRVIVLGPLLAAEVREWVRSNGIGPDDLLFSTRKGTPKNRGNFLERSLRPAAQRAGIAASNVDFRMLRRSFATAGNAFGLDLKAIQSQMGHANPNITASVYMQPVDGVRVRQIEQFELMLRGKIPMPVDMETKLGPSRIQ